MNLDLTNEKWSILAINIILGAVLIYSYYYYITKGGVDIKTLWGKAYKIQNIYTLSLILCVVSWLLLTIFVIFKTPNTTKNKSILSNLMVIQLIIITISMLWLPLTILYVKEKKTKVLTMLGVLLVLFIVAMASFKQFRLVNSLKAEDNDCAKRMKTAAIVGAGYFFFHTLVLDFAGWNYGFFSN